MLNSIKTYLFLLFLSLIIPFEVSAQIRTIHTGSFFTIGENAKMTIIGDLKDSSQTADREISNFGSIFLNGSIQNFGVNNVFGTAIYGYFQFFGPASQSVSGIFPTQFCNLEVDLDGQLLNINKKTIVNDSLLLRSGDIFLFSDTLVLAQLSNSSVSGYPSGIIGETNDKRIFGPSFPVMVQGATFNMGGSTVNPYEKLKGIGLSFQNGYISSTPGNIYRWNIGQSAGPTLGSVERTYKFDDIASPSSPTITQISSKFHDPLELPGTMDGTDMHIYYSEDGTNSWRDIEGTSGTGEVTSPTHPKTLNNQSVITVSKNDCDILPTVDIKQVITATSDTLLLADGAIISNCDANAADVRLLAFGDAGTYEWFYENETTSEQIAYSSNSLFIPTHTTGRYKLLLTNTRGCSDTAIVVLEQAYLGNANFTVSDVNACDQDNITFTPVDPDSTTLAPGYSYEWDLGEGSPVLNYNANITYTTYGSYEVSLTVTTNNGCVSQESQTVNVFAIPTPAFSATSACPGAVVQFTNETVSDPLAIPAQNLFLNWNFGDGNSDVSTGLSNGANGDITHIYAMGGDTTVTLTASDINGCQGTITGTITVHPLPEVNFDYNAACEGQVTQFNDSSEIEGGTPLTYHWDFTGVGPTSTDKDPTYIFSNSTGYWTTLTVTSVEGCVNDTTKQVLVDEIPTAIISPILSDVCENQIIGLSGAASLTSSSFINFEWDFDDGSATVDTIESDVNHSYPSFGTYDVQLTVTTQQNCTSTTNYLLLVYQGPTVGFTATGVGSGTNCEKSTFNLTNSTTNAVTYQWGIPGTSFSETTSSTSTIFNTPGYHQIELTATSINGCESYKLDSVYVNPLPQGNFGDTTRSCITSITLDADDSGLNAGYLFLWNNGLSGYDESIVNVNSGNTIGDYTVTITSDQGCAITDQTYVLLNAAIEPDLGIDGDVCDSIFLDAGYYGTGTDYKWTDLNTGDTLSVTDQSFWATTDGYYKVDITTNTNLPQASQCTGEDSIIVIVNTVTPVELNGPYIACVGDVVTLDAGSNWEFTTWDDGSTNFALNVTESGFYTVTADSSVCSSTDFVEVTFNPSPVFSLPQTLTSCEFANLDVFTNNCTYEWYDGTTTSAHQTTHTGVDTLWVEVTLTTTTCVLRDSVEVTINPNPTINLGADTTICSYDTLQLDAGNGLGHSFLWNNNTTNQTLTVSASSEYSVTVTNNTTTCFNDASIIVNSLPLFNFDLGDDLLFCGDSTSELNVEPGLGLNNATYNWYNLTGALSTTEDYAVKDTGMLYLEVTDEFGCIASDSVDILPSNLSLTAVFLAMTEVVKKDTVYFINLSYPRPYQSFWEIEDYGYTSLDSSISYAFPEAGFFDVRLTVNNGTCISSIEKTITVRNTKSKIEKPDSPPSLYINLKEVMVYPNPNNGSFSLRVELGEEANVQVAIYNLLGQLILTDSFDTKKTDRQYSLNNIEKGMYLINVRAGKNQQTVKFIKIDN